LPISPNNKYSFEEFFKISKSYYKELYHVFSEKDSISNEDILVIYDLMKESIFYLKDLVKKKFYNEAKELTQLYLKYTEIIFDVIPQNDFKINHMPYFLSISFEEINFQIYFALKNYNQCIEILIKINLLQRKIQLPKFYIGCTQLYHGIVLFSNFD
jgi:hypothetical protein